MLYPAIGKLLETTNSRYSLVIAVAKRARQIVEDAEENNLVLDHRPVKLAINDIADQVVKVVINEDADYDGIIENPNALYAAAHMHDSGVYADDLLSDEEYDEKYREDEDEEDEDDENNDDLDLD